MDIVGNVIIHKTFKSGKITAFDGEYIWADFPSKGKIVQLSFSPEFIKLYEFPDLNISTYLHALVKEMVEDKEINKSQPIVYVESPYRLVLSDLPIHNMIFDGVLYPIIVCASTRSFCFHKDHMFEPRKHITEMRNMIVGCLERDGNANIGAEYCFDCDEYKIDGISIYFYERNYGKMILIKQHEGKSHNGNVVQSSMSWDSATKLTEIGYNVRANGYTEPQRHRLLSYIIDNNLLTLSEVMITIRQARNMKMDLDYARNKAAIGRWNNDLEFLEQHYILNQKATLGELKQSV